MVLYCTGTPLSPLSDRIGSLATARKPPGRTPDGHSTPRRWPAGPEAARERAHTTGQRQNTKRRHIHHSGVRRGEAVSYGVEATRIPSLAASLPSPSPSFRLSSPQRPRRSSTRCSSPRVSASLAAVASLWPQTPPHHARGPGDVRMCKMGLELSLVP